MKIEIHLLQNVAPSCLNRDDTNTPKSCTFGGATRARVSSQSWKRAVRELFRVENSVPVGSRTKLLRSEMLRLLLGTADETAAFPIGDLLPVETVPYAVDTFLQTYYSAMDPKKTQQTKVLVFASIEEMNVAAKEVIKLLGVEKSELKIAAEKRRKIIEKLQAQGEEALEEALAATELTEEVSSPAKGKSKEKLPEIKPIKEVSDALRTAQLTSDIALFGQMLAENAKTNVSAACQVAHAISTHSASLENDFFTAVDDLTHETGAGMLGTQGFNSACLYRYALIDRDQLIRNLGGDIALADETIKAFLRAFTLAIPSAKQNSHAAQNPPSFGLFIARDNGVPVSLANAFAKPVSATKQYPDIVGSSIYAIDDYHQKMQSLYGLYDGATTAVFCDRLPALLSGSDANLIKANAGGLNYAITAIMARVSGVAA